MNVLNEQNNGLIRLDGTRQPLPILNAWKRSSSAYWIEPDAPYAAMNFKVGKPDASGFASTIAMQYHPTRGLWRVYVPGGLLTAKCETGYKIVAVDEYGNRSVGGEGMLRVHEGKIYDLDDEETTSEECYAYFPDGLWRKVTVSTDSVGELIFVVSQTGISPSVFEEVPTTPYAFNKTSNLYYAVTGFVDTAGEAYLQIAQTGVSGQTDRFAKNETTGFYYRVEAFTDTSGQIAPKVGDQKS